jgi:Family of unknown function (DUF6572)
MAVDEPGVVDIVSVDPSGCFVLTVSDHLDWSDTIAHQIVLQEKLNRYLAFIESGEIHEKYPNVQDRKVMIRVVTQHYPDAQGLQFLDRVKAAIEQAGCEFSHRQYSA